MTTCKTCPATINPRNQSGYCRKCWNRSPDKRAKTIEACKRAWRDPATRAKYVEAGKRNLNLPGVREKALAVLIERKTWEIARQHITPEHRAKAARRGNDTKLAHIPRELRDEYKRLTRSLRYSAEEASALILDQHERDMARFRARLTDG